MQRETVPQRSQESTLLRYALTFTFAVLGATLPCARPLVAAEPLQITVVGGLGGVSQYTKHEEPFWTRRVPEITGGQVRAEITPFDQSGIRGQQMLPLLRLGTVSFGSVLLGLAAADEPELNAMDLPTVSPDLSALRQTVALWRPQLDRTFRDRFGLEVLAIYTYPAQVVFCRQSFSSLSDLAGRRVRTSSVGQSELVTALGGTPVVIPFAEVVSAIKSNITDCAITGALSGNTIGLHEVTTHVSKLAISWGISVFAANAGTWSELPQQVRAQLRQGLAQLEEEIWTAAGKETADGFACNAGQPSCSSGRAGRMTLVQAGPADEALRLRLLAKTVLPGWIARCGSACADAWNRIAAQVVGVTAPSE